MDAVVAFNATRVVRKRGEDRRDFLCVRLQVRERETVGDRERVSARRQHVRSVVARTIIL